MARFRCSPHTRGWTGHAWRHPPGSDPCSPHTRGWTGAQILATGSEGGVPRTRGDGPAVSTAADERPRCSPHTRGWTGLDVQPVCPDGGVPRTRGDGPLATGVPAGNFQRVPRTRGDGPYRVLSSTASSERVPRTRGDGPDDDVGIISQLAVFPTHAGMDRTC